MDSIPECLPPIDGQSLLTHLWKSDITNTLNNLPTLDLCFRLKLCQTTCTYNKWDCYIQYLDAHKMCICPKYLTILEWKLTIRTNASHWLSRVLRGLCCSSYAETWFYITGREEDARGGSGVVAERNCLPTVETISIILKAVWHPRAYQVNINSEYGNLPKLTFDCQGNRLRI